MFALRIVKFGKVGIGHLSCNNSNNVFLDHGLEFGSGNFDTGTLRVKP
jgi:hypothetical protein